ncbi:MAG TPA: tetratricopeptide repeat protein [Thermoanaerobaculia bacterium]|nr:tetratricopeptide repeat protein [Thermoanaerobaculia bacterium]
MAQPATTAKLEELRFKLKTDPKSRLFYQLAEELRKAGYVDESEQVLRSGLQVYPTYLAAWVSLGRTLREQRNDAGAVEALNRALQLDPGNVVAARILADAYLALGDKVEAIKKYKLVHALLPADEELNAVIERIQRELAPPPIAEPEPEPVAESPFEETSPTPAYASGAMGSQPVVVESDGLRAHPSSDVPFEEEESPFDRTMPPFAEAARSLEEEARIEEVTADAEPMSLEHEESPFEEPVDTFTAAAMTVEAPIGMHIESAPLAAEVAAPIFETEETIPDIASEDAANTATMADLYVKQGLVEEARHIYENILARDPENAEVRGKLDAIVPRVNPKVAALERWLGRVSRREVGGV